MESIIIVVKSQEELNAIDASISASVYVEFGTEKKPAILDVDENSNLLFIIKGDYYAEAHNYSRVETHRGSRVEALNNSRVNAFSYSVVTARDKSFVKAKGNSRVLAVGNSTVYAYDNSIITYDLDSTVYPHDDAKLEFIWSFLFK